MKITIAKRFLPFSHLPGIEVLIPASRWVLQAFPALLIFYELGKKERHEVRLGTEGLMLDFTVEVDLEKDRVRVFGHDKNKYHHITISLQQEGLEIDFGGQKQVIQTQVDRYKTSREKLSFGMHKTLDWDLVCRRKDIKEILPIWFYLGSKYVSDTAVEKQINFLEVFLVGFKGIFVPHPASSAGQGIHLDSYADPLFFLIEGARQIRAAFFQEGSEGDWYFFSSTKFQMDAGRFVGIKTEHGDLIDLEWSKKKMRRLVIHPAKTRRIGMHLQKGLSSYRLRTNIKERGIRIEVGQPLALEEGKKVYLDRFE